MPSMSLRPLPPLPSHQTPCWVLPVMVVISQLLLALLHACSSRVNRRQRPRGRLCSRGKAAQPCSPSAVRAVSFQLVLRRVDLLSAFELASPSSSRVQSLFEPTHGKPTKIALQATPGEPSSSCSALWCARSLQKRSSPPAPRPARGRRSQDLHSLLASQMKLAVAALLVGSAGAIQGPSPCCAAPRCASPRVEGLASLTDGIWDMSPSMRIEGNSLRTWDIGAETTERVQVSIRSAGRPIDTCVELWHTPSYIPMWCKVSCEDGSTHPFHTIIETPKHPKTVAVFNTEAIEFPLEASVADTGLGRACESFASEKATLVQGGETTSYTFGPEVESVQVLLKTDERNMKALIELTQGPNDDDQTIELYASDGHTHPFYTVIQTPGGQNTLRIINQNTVEFPFDAYVRPHETASDQAAEPEVVMGSGVW